MKRLPLCVGLLLGCFVFALATPAVQADPVPKKYRKAIRKGLQWLVKTQNKDGHWDSGNGQYKAPMTALAGMAMLMEGSTVRAGKYAKNIRRAVDWLIRHTQKGGPNDGLITDPGERSRYMYGHGFSLMFLSCVYGDEQDKERRRKLKDVLTRAAKFCVRAQSNQGGWYYTGSGGTNNDEGSVTVTQLQALRAARNAGIPVPKAAIQKAKEYLHKSTTTRGGVIYRLGNNRLRPTGGERPALTAAALACAFSMGDYKGKFVQKWFRYCQTALPVGVGGARMGHDEYTQYYYAQAVYMLGDDGWEKLFGRGNKGITWTQYRKQMFDGIVGMQNGDGSFSRGGGWSVGAVYSTSIYLTILQLDNNALPLYQR